MTQLVRFVDGVSYTEADQSDYNLNMMRPQGIIPESPLGVLSFSAIGSMAVRIGPGEAHVQGFQYKNDANVDLGIGANTSGSQRIDYVVLALNRAANTLVLAVIPGTPGAGAPTLIQVPGGNWQFPICGVTVVNNASSITGANLGDYRVYSRWPAAALDTVMATDADVIAEATARGTADNTLQSNITAEGTTRANADTAEATARGNADTTLQNNINTEASTRASADTTLQTNINNVVNNTLIPRAKGKIQYDGAVLSSTGLASVTKMSAGFYRLNWAVAFASAQYVLIGTIHGTAHMFGVVSMTTTYAEVCVYNAQFPNGPPADVTFFFAAWAP